MKKLLFITLIALSLFTTSCTEDLGGNADISTIDIVVYKSDWIEYGTLGKDGYCFAVDLNVPELTNNVIENGMVSVYIKSGDSWTPVPVYVYHEGFQGGYIYAIKRGVFSIEYYESDQKTVRPETQTFRLVIVQPI